MVSKEILLTLLIVVPIIGGICALLVNDKLAKTVALLFSLVTFAMSIQLYTDFNNEHTGMYAVEKAQRSTQFEFKTPWIEAYKINYHVGVDGLSMPLIILTAFITILVILSAWQVIKFRAKQYFAAFLIMNGVMIGVFSSLDAILFYLFWEAMLIPMFLIIGVWGGPNRVYATIKFFLYTFFGSVFMLVALIYMANQVPGGVSFAIQDFFQLSLSKTEQIYIFIAFLMAFAVKVPMWPVHTWLPDAHVEAPTGGSVILAAIMLKIGGYGFLRFSLPMTPIASMELSWLIILMSLVAVVYIGLVALAQTDMKKLIAYSSIAHMGFVTLGFFIIFAIMAYNIVNPVAGVTLPISGAGLAIEGGMVQMISHGFISAAMFLCVGVLYDRMHSRDISAYGGVVNKMPVFAAFSVLFAMANAGLPGTSGFVGEFMVILAAFKANFWYAFLAATTLILGAAYTLWMVKRVIFGDVANENVEKLEDVNKREFFILGILAFTVLFFGLWPDTITSVLHQSVTDLLTHIHDKVAPHISAWAGIGEIK